MSLYIKTLAAALLVLPALASAESGERWESTTKVHMEGMGELPTMTIQDCREPGFKKPPKMGDKDKDCQMTKFDHSGNTVIWEVACTGKEKMTGRGTITHTSDSYTGAMDMDSSHGKIHMDMSGHKTGSCDTSTDTAPVVNGMQMPNQQQMAQYQQQIQSTMAIANVQMCTNAVMSMQVEVFTMAGSPCASQTANFCERLKSPEGAHQAMEQSSPGHDVMSQGAALCGVNKDDLSKNSCAGAVSAKDWDFLKMHCPADADVIVKTQCAGRSYSSVAGTEYGDFCTRYAADQMAQPEPTKESLKDKAQKGIDTIKGLIKW